MDQAGGASEGSERSRSITLLVSSVSARGRALRTGRHVAELLHDGGWDVTVVVMTSEHSVRAEAGRATSDYLGALGGDGFLTEAAKGARVTGVPLIPFPSGRGNDLCRSLGIGADPNLWAKVVAQAGMEEIAAWTRPLDAMQVTTWDDEGTEHKDIALGIISLGVDGAANQIANESWMRSGPLAYTWGTIIGFLGRYTPRRIKVEIGGKIEEIGGWLFSISNSGWFGGGVNILPNSNSQDGKLELLTVDPIPRWKVLGPLMRVLLSRESNDPVVAIRTITDIRILGPVGMAAMADGDVVAHIPFDVDVVPAALRVVATNPKEFLK